MSQIFKKGKQIIFGFINPLIILSAPFFLVSFLIIIISYDNNIFNASVTYKNVFSEFIYLMFKTTTWKAIYCTLFLAFKGLFGGFVFTVMLTVFLGLYPRHISKFINFINGLRAIPLTLLIPFLGSIPFIPFFLYPPLINESLLSQEPGYLISIGCFLFFIIGICDGIENRNINREQYFRKIIGFSRFKYFKAVLFYEILPFFFTSLRLSFTFALVLSIVLEQLIPYQGIGRLISDKISERSIGSIHAAQSVALFLIIAIIGVIFDLIYRYLKFRSVSWSLKR